MHCSAANACEAELLFLVRRLAGRVGKARQVPLWSSLQNCCCTLRESTTRPPRTDPHARTHSRPKAASSGRAAHELLNPRVLTAFLCQAGTSGSDLALTKPPSRRRRAEPSLLDLPRRAEQKPSAPCPQLNRRKFEFACKSPLKRSTLRCSSSTTCGFLQVSDPSTPLSYSGPFPSHPNSPPPPTPPVAMGESRIHSSVLQLSQNLSGEALKGKMFRASMWQKDCIDLGFTSEK